MKFNKGDLVVVAKLPKESKQISPLKSIVGRIGEVIYGGKIVVVKYDHDARQYWIHKKYLEHIFTL